MEVENASGQTRAFALPPLSLGFGSVQIIEWLSPDERKTGQELVQWMHARGLDANRPIHLHAAHSAADVLTRIGQVASETLGGGPKPVLHIEAHGDSSSPLAAGFVGPSQAGELEVLRWPTIAPELVKLNIACQCDLLIVSAACWGQAVMLASSESSRLPFVASVGFSTEVSPHGVSESMKEFYRRIFDSAPDMEAIVSSARSELCDNEGIEWDSIPRLTAEALVKALLTENEPDRFRTRALNIAQRLIGRGNVPLIDKLPLSTAIATLNQQQGESARRLWNTRFMVDLYPGNAERFAFDVEGLVDHVLNGASARQI